MSRTPKNPKEAKAHHPGYFKCTWSSDNLTEIKFLQLSEILDQQPLAFCCPHKLLHFSVSFFQDNRLFLVILHICPYPNIKPALKIFIFQKTLSFSFQFLREWLLLQFYTALYRNGLSDPCPIKEQLYIRATKLYFLFVVISHFNFRSYWPISVSSKSLLALLFWMFFFIESQLCSVIIFLLFCIYQLAFPCDISF